MQDNFAIVTGAAGGMGRAIAIAFAEQGRHLILSDLHSESLKALANELGKAASIEFVVGDITAADYGAKIVAALGGGRIDALVHTAGVSPSMADGKRVFAINFTATKHLTEAVVPHMAEGGVVVLIASNAGHTFTRPSIDRAVRKAMAGRRSAMVSLLLRSSRLAYPVSKRAVQLYAQQMAPAFGRVGARIVSLSPGIIDTGMGRLEQQAGPEIDRMIAVTPLQRMGRPEEIAAAVTFLTSSAASYVTGTDLLVDGGTIAGIADAGGVLKLR